MHNFGTAQHINKQITDISSTINALQNVNALQNGTKLGTISPRSFDAT